MIKSPLVYIIPVILFLLIGCNQKPSPDELKIQRVVSSDFDEADQVSLEIHEDFEMTLWAPGPLLNNAVSLSFDPKGRAYVSETARRKSSDLDIREHPDWMTEDISLETLEDTKALHLAKLAIANSDQNNWLEDFNKDGSHDYKDLMVQSERIRIIEDLDKDGRADVSHIFAEEFNGMLTGIAAGILFHQDNVYLTCAPDLWKISDDNADGIADSKESISHGYGIHVAYAGHDMSGVTIGPDGKLYWSIGDIGVNTKDRTGRHWEFPHEGAVMRCNQDGSDFEVFAHGLRNPQEIAFNAYGDLISVDNDGDHPGEHERYVHIIEGSDSGWRTYWQFGKYNNPNEQYKVWTDEKLHVPHFKGQAAYITPPIGLAPDGPCGLTYNPGNNLGKDWEDYFYATYFTGSESRSKIEAFRLERSGSTLSLVDVKLIAKGIVPTGLEFGPAGDLYVNDWKSGYDKKPAGRIWKITVKDEMNKRLQDETYRILNSNWASLSTDTLVDLLAFHDQRIRLQAQFELVKRKSIRSFESVLEDDSKTIPRIHALWGLGQLGSSHDYDCLKLIIPLKEQDAEIRVQSAKVLGENKVVAALDDLLICLEDSSLRVVRHAVEAIGKLEDIAALPHLMEYINLQDSIGPHLRHALSFALSRLENVAEELGQKSNHPSIQVRMVSVLALRQLKSNYIIKYIHDSEESIATEVARAIHDDKSIEDALPHLANSLNQTKCKHPAFLRRAINANLRVGDQISAKRLATFASGSAAEELKTEAIISLGYWNAPPVLDRVEGRYRKLTGHTTQDSKDAIGPLFHAADFATKSMLSSSIINAVGSLRYTELEKELLAILKQENNDIENRISSLSSIAKLDINIEEAFAFANKSNNRELRKASLDLLSSPQIPDQVRIELVESLLLKGNILEKQKSILALGTLNSATSILETWIDKAIEGKVQPELLHEVLVAANQSKDDEVNSLVELYWNAIDLENPLDEFKESLYGGNAESGKHIFYASPSMPCTQCHVINKEGGTAGPDLSTIGTDLTREDLLLSIVAPNARIAPGYGNMIITTKDQKTIVGMVQEETDKDIILKDPTGKIFNIPQETIDTKEQLPSGMITGANILSKGDIRDLVEYLTSLK